MILKNITMIKLKTIEEIKILREGGKFLGQILRDTAALVKPGVTTAALNEYAEKRIYDLGGRPSFKNFTGGGDVPFPAGLCTSVNEEIVHGIPSEARVLQEGDIISLDIGMEYKGLYTDMAVTVPVGNLDSELHRLIQVTKESLYKGIAAMKVGGDLSEIGKAVQAHAEAAGYGVVRDLVGHGVGHSVHEAPQVPNYKASFAKNIKLVPGLVIAIEPMITIGSYDIEVLDDEWTIVTADRSLSAHWEHTVAVTENGIEILTELD